MCRTKQEDCVHKIKKIKYLKLSNYLEPNSAITDPEVSVAIIKQRGKKKTYLKFLFTYPRSRMGHKSKMLWKENGICYGCQKSTHDNLHFNGLQTHDSCLRILSTYPFPRNICRVYKLHSLKMLLIKYVCYFCEVVTER